MMRATTRSPSPASTMFGSDDEISNTSDHPQPRRHPARRKSSATTLAGSVNSHEKASRTIVLCLEGSDQRFGVDYAKDFMSTLEKGNPMQKVYCNHPKGAGLSRYLIEKQLLESYTWLADNYKLGDKLCILGFAQGANAARKLCGMINKVGMLPSGNHEQVKFAYKHYQNAENDPKAAQDFKEACSIESDGQTVMIDFVGLWDTHARHIPTTSSPNPSIRVFRHALLIKRNRTKDWPRLAEKAACHLQLRPEGETPLQWITKECLLADAGVKLRKWQDPVEASDMQMKERVFRYFTMPVA